MVALGSRLPSRARVGLFLALLVLPALFVALALTARSRAEAPVLGLTALGILVLPWLLFCWWPLLGQGDRLYQGGIAGAAAGGRRTRACRCREMGGPV